VEEAALEAAALNAKSMANGREARALPLLQLEQRAQQWKQGRNVDTQQGALAMAAEVTATLNRQGTMEECIKSMKGGASNVRWFDRTHGELPDGKLFSST
jgi:hypothetical protein